MATFSLISNIVEDQKTPKKKFQVFEVQIGFEKAQVCLPFEAADNFEKAANLKSPKTLNSLRSIVLEFGGEIL